VEGATRDGEGWLAEWRKRSTGVERMWDAVSKRVAEFLEQSGELCEWVPLNERVASLSEMGAKLATSEPALGRSVREFVARLRERFATGTWEPVRAHREAQQRIGELERQSHGVLFSRVKAYLAEAEEVRTKFREFLAGRPPAIDSGLNGGPPFDQFYAWVVGCFRETAIRFRDRRGCGHLWSHPTRKSQSWVDVDGQLSRAFETTGPVPTYSALKRIGELLTIMREGFVLAASSRGELVIDAPEQATDLAALPALLASGRVRVRVEWIRGAERQPK
jgi:hypothetical protein